MYGSTLWVLLLALAFLKNHSNRTGLKARRTTAPTATKLMTRIATTIQGYKRRPVEFCHKGSLFHGKSRIVE